MDIANFGQNVLEQPVKLADIPKNT